MLTAPPTTCDQIIRLIQMRLPLKKRRDFRPFRLYILSKPYIHSLLTHQKSVLTRKIYYPPGKGQW